MPPLRILSLGAGVQSTTVLLMSLMGELPKLDGAVFADTGWEPAPVYAHLAKLEALAMAEGVPVYRVGRAKGIREAALDASSRFVTLPVFITSPEGKAGKARRQCTKEFKIEPIRSQLWKLHLANARCGIEQWFGISWDEAERMKDSDARYITHQYPLIDRRMTRADCHTWMADHGWSAPRSACIGCPFHSDAEWRRIRDQDPAAWADAIDFDLAIRGGHGGEGRLGQLRGTAYLHRQRVPLAQVDLRTKAEQGQEALFPEFADDGCDTGYCGR